MAKTIRELTADLLAAPSACKEVKEAAQNYLDAAGKEGEAAAAKAYVAELEADIMPIDGLISFAGSDMGAKVFGADGAKNILAHAKERKAAGAKYCDWDKENRLPLIIKGARQIGKTESIVHFASENYENIVFINSVLEGQYKTILSDGYCHFFEGF